MLDINGKLETEFSVIQLFVKCNKFDKRHFLDNYSLHYLGTYPIIKCYILICYTNTEFLMDVI